MKKVSKVFAMLLGFLSGFLTGAFVHLEVEILANRPVTMDGGLLSLPLIVLLFCFGFSFGKAVKLQTSYHRVYQEGRHDGYWQGRADSKIPQLRVSCNRPKVHANNKMGP